MFKKQPIFLSLCILLAASWQQAEAAITAAEADRLGNDLTPLGAEKAGNAAGTIPAWEGGITTPPAGYQKGMHHPDPYSGDGVLFTINASNVNRYMDQLSIGHQALLKAYDTYKMPIYPTRRSASNPQRVYDATKRIALVT